MAGALIVTAEMEPADFRWLDALRREHYPPDRNILPAHLTLFHALPPSAEEEARRILSLIAGEFPRPAATVPGLMKLGGGTAFRIVSPQLDSIRGAIADHFHGALSAQDSQGWAPHVTIQNKASSSEARALFEKLERGFRPRPLGIRGLALNRYLDGPWERIATYSFRGLS
jgi:hypothetical protein